MNTKERTIIGIVLLLISLITTFDIITDMKEGATWWHISIEACVAIIALISLFYLMQQSFKLKHKLEIVKYDNEKILAESEKWKKSSKKFIDGLSLSIDLQLDAWKLTNSEKEIAFLLIKGYSLKEIAEIRNTAEKTARAQSTSIYSKSGLAGRNQLSAFFLEDLFLPNQNL